MTEKITYYAIVDDSTSRERPAGVLRRVENDAGEVDEVLSRNLKWEFSPLLYSAERGDLANDFVLIGAEEAAGIEARIRDLPRAAADEETVVGGEAGSAVERD